jgi:glutathionylspermidine synthase
MRRVPTTPRPDWPAKVESQGLHFHSLDDQPYWDEGAYYEFTAGEVDELEKATYALNDLCLKAVDHVVTTGRFDLFGMPPPFVEWLKRSWDKDEQTVYGRFDFAFDGKGPPKLLEYNADTPTGLLEAAVVQWYWLQDTHAGGDQFNSIHERLLEFWPQLSPKPEGAVHFTSLGEHLEDFMTVNYLRDTAQQTGLNAVYLPIEEIGWNSARRQFVDSDEGLIRTCFKLYPWEWLIREKFGPHLLESKARWLEPPWKLLLSHKAILTVLWELFPESPYLLPTFREPTLDSYVQKPVQGREGANVRLVKGGTVEAETDGPYGDQPCVYQAVQPLPCFDGNYPVVGSWLVNGYSCGVGIREDHGPITQNTSRFVPHMFSK